VETVVLLAGLFRALVNRELEAHLVGEPSVRVAAPLLRAAMWRAARSGLEGDLVDLPAARPVPAGVAVKGLLDLLRPQLEAVGDWDTVVDLADRAVSRGSSAARQRAVLTQGGGLTDVVDLLVAQTRGDRS
jgi:carboxylate-amine ligase